MNIESLREYCLSKPHVTEEFPFGPDTLVFKIAGKVFLLTGLDETSLSFNAKCDPEWAIELREGYPNSIIPGYHMNKKHWNTVMINGEIESSLVTRLIDHSYELVFTGLPKDVQTSLK